MMNMGRFKDVPAVATKYKLGNKQQTAREIVKHICMGEDREEIRQALITDKWKLGRTYTKTVANTLIRIAIENMERRYDEQTIQKYRPKLIAYYMDLYKECRQEHDRTNAIKILKEVGLMIGAYEQVEKKTENNIVAINFGFDVPDPSTTNIVQYDHYGHPLDHPLKLDDGTTISNTADEKPEESVFTIAQQPL